MRRLRTWVYDHGRLRLAAQRNAMKKLSPLVVFLIGSIVHAEDWPGWLGPRRDGSSVEKVAPWKGDVKVLWRKPVGEGHSSPIISGGKVYLHTKVKGKDAEQLDAFDLTTGEPVWTKSYDHDKFVSKFGLGPRGTPTAVDGKIYTNGITGVLTCFDAKKGDILWQVDTLKDYKAKNLLFGVSGSPLVVGDRVFVNVGGPGASLVAVDRATGKPAWQSLDDKASYSSPILVKQGGKDVLVFLTATNLVGVDPKDGSKIWQQPFKDLLFESSATPVVAGDILFGSSITLGGIGMKLTDAGATKAWMKPDLNCYFSTPVVIKGDLYLVTGSLLAKKATLRCVDPATGEQRWKRDDVGKYHSSLARTGDDKLILVEEAGNLVLVDPDPKEYRELARSKIGRMMWAHPALSDGKLVIRDDRDLICVELPK